MKQCWLMASAFHLAIFEHKWRVIQRQWGEKWGLIGIIHCQSCWEFPQERPQGCSITLTDEYDELWTHPTGESGQVNIPRTYGLPLVIILAISSGSQEQLVSQGHHKMLLPTANTFGKGTPTLTQG